MRKITDIVKKIALKWKIPTGILLAAVLIGGGVWYGWSAGNKGTTKEANTSQGLVIADNTTDWSGADSGVPSIGIRIPGYENIAVEESTGTAEVRLVNPPGNPCYFQYALTIADSGQVIYQSDLIEPGKAIDGFKAANIPAKGSYNLYVVINTFSMDGTMSSMNGAKVKAKLNVV